MPKLSDAVKFDVDPIGGTSGVILHGCLELHAKQSVADGADSRLITQSQGQIRRSIVETIQPRAEFEAAFQDLRNKIQGLNLSSMGDTMAVLGAIADLKEKLLLK